MSSPYTRHPSSYRDPSGFLFYKNGVLFRQVNQVYKKDFELFISSGLYEHLVNKNILIEHQALEENLTGSPDWHQTLQPEALSFISYPYEWCFDMLTDAALLTLEATKEAMKFGMMLKDASAYNVQFYKGKMMFIDTLSFERYDEQNPWIAYRQFCEHFFAPLALMHYLKEPLQHLLVGYPDGIPLALTKKLLPLKSKFRLSSYLHVHLHASLSKNAGKRNGVARSFSHQKMKNLLKSLEDGIKAFSFTSRSGIWSGYYDEARQRKNYIPQKKEIIGKWTNDLRLNTILDAGANEGEFSEFMQKKASYIISADFDHYAVNQWYNTIKQKNISNIHPLILDLSRPSPSIGVNNQERSSFIERIKVDLILALALVHHLAIGKNIPFDSIAEMFHSIGNYLVIEFVPKTDEKVKLMLEQKKDVYPGYTQENFEKAFEKKFRLLEKVQIEDSQRIMYFFKKIDIN